MTPISPLYLISRGPRKRLERATAAVLRRLGPFQIPHAFAAEQGTVLLPVAIHACADLMDLFYPTLELKANTRRWSRRWKGRSQATPIRIIEVTASMKTPFRKRSCVEGEQPCNQLFRAGHARGEEKEKTVYTRKVLFVKGAMEKIENREGEMEEAPLGLFAAGSAGPLSEEELFYEINRAGRAF
ncbi:hypothetical protein [Aminivibrio sp.]|uniref:hypothetical protein n=1 Tax=Aminivibrio sp. TaxID=1872489 RepID=UPI00345E775F